MLVARELPRPELVLVEARSASANAVADFDPHLWASGELAENTRLGDRLRAVGLAWGLERVKVAKGVGKIEDAQSEHASESCFTGKEEDVEVGLQYFGKRFLSPYLNRWVSPDPLAVHAPGEADLNVYAYVSARTLRSVDPIGLFGLSIHKQMTERALKAAARNGAVIMVTSMRDIHRGHNCTGSA